jgi:hypothetical protein
VKTGLNEIYIYLEMDIAIFEEVLMQAENVLIYIEKIILIEFDMPTQGVCSTGYL